MPAPANPVPKLPFEPLRRQIALRGASVNELLGGEKSAESRAYFGAQREGGCTLRAADALCARLGLSPWDLWPDLL